MPFSARDIIPLIERAMEQAQHMPPGGNEPPQPLSSQPPPAQTRLLGDEPPEPPPQVSTKILGDEGQFVRKQFGTTHLFEDADEADDDVPAQTRNLDQPPSRPPSTPSQTRRLDEEDVPPPPSRPAQTRNLDDDSPRIKPLRPAAPPSDPRSADASPIKPINREAGTRRFDDEADSPPIKPLRREPTNQQPGYGVTRDFSQDAPEPPPSVPEVSSLESVLLSFGFDPPVGAEDTPAVPSSDREALRQFLATSDQRSGDADTFDDILGAIDPSDIDDSQRQETPFEGLVKSMQRTDEPHRPLPERQSKVTDFTLTSGMDAVLREIARSKTAPLTEPPPPPTSIPEEPSIPKPKPKTTFQKLAQEEPPPPTFEESGTVGDLMLGVSDSGFRNVLSLLRGDEVEAPSERSSETVDPYTSFFGPSLSPTKQASPEDAKWARPAASENRPDTYQFDDSLPEEPGEATIAQVILQTALEDAQLSDGSSLNQLLTDIENRLSMHKLSVKPLPSWNMDTGVFRPVSEAEIREPDFLPEFLPPGEEITFEASLEFDEPESYTGRTTMPSVSNQRTIKPVPEDEDTLFDARFIEETAASEVIPAEEAPAPPESVPPDWLLDAASAVEETTDSVVLSEDTSPTAAALLDQIMADEADKAVEQEPEMQEGASFLAPLLKNAPSPEIAPDVPEVVNEDAWDAVVQTDTAPAEAQESFPAEDDWALEPGVDESWDIPPEGAVEEAISSGVVADDWDLSPTPETEQVIPEDPYIAQLALNLTQFSLESSSEGSILTRDGEVVAYAGHLSEDDTLELRDAINNDWDANPEGARIRFISLPSSGKDYMLYSIRTDGDLTLSMVFAGTTPLRVIRQQGQRLIAALESIPDAIEAVPVVEVVPSQIVPVEPAIDESLLNAYSYVWLLNDPEAHITDAVAQAIIAGLNIQLKERGWKINDLQVHEDFVYLYAALPGETPSHEIMRDLKRRSADIAHAQNPDLTPQMLWADAYLILAPGRELQTEEILEFINFQRMA
jgi:REP element-mobilizing transposase RayT